jgi:hypothetical protein
MPERFVNERNANDYEDGSYESHQPKRSTFKNPPSVRCISVIDFQVYISDPLGAKQIENAANQWDEAEDK